MRLLSFREACYIWLGDLRNAIPLTLGLLDSNCDKIYRSDPVVDLEIDLNPYLSEHLHLERWRFSLCRPSDLFVVYPL